MKWLRKFWQWLWRGSVSDTPKMENHFDHAKKVVQSWPKWKQRVGICTGKPSPNDHLEKFIRSAVDVKPDEIVEIRPEGVVVQHAGQPKPPVSFGDPLTLVTIQSIILYKLYGNCY